MKIRVYYRLYRFFARLESWFFLRWIAQYQRVNHIIPKG